MRRLDEGFGEALEEVWRRVIAGEPIALSRFGEGEAKLMQGKQIKLVDDWSFSGGVSLLAEDLKEAASCKDLIQGIGCGCCDPEGKQYLSEVCQGELTYANLFVNGNYNRFIDMLSQFGKPVFLIANRKAADFASYPLFVSGFYGVPGDCVRYYASAKEKLLEDAELIASNWKDCLILIAAGPIGTVLPYFFRKFQPTIQVLDIGSTLDPWIFGKETRPYQSRGSKANAKVCVL